MKIRMFVLMAAVLMAAGDVYANTAVAELKPTAPGSRLKGSLKFVEEKGGVMVLGEIWNAPAGKHGIHIHEKSSCANQGQAAGGHLNPSGLPHGFAPKDAPFHAHPGDMGNFEVDVDGHGTLKLHMPDLGLAAKARYDIRNLAVILNDKADDFSQPSGNAGDCIACGLILEA
ncbi:MAG: superoxide dismutase family protein [Candidatus Omnitrophota bacterium]